MGHQDERTGQSFRDESPVRVSQPRAQTSLPISSRHIWTTMVLFGMMVFVVGLALDLFLIHQRGLRPLTAAAILNVFFGVLAGSLVYRLLAFEREKCDRMLERLEIVDEMNHHIRNALQVISFSTHGTSTEPELSEINNAVMRIQWAVREILPRVEPEFTSFERSAKPKPPDSPANA